jgi:hypothetical protein
LTDESVSDNAEGQLGERGDEVALKPLRVEEVGAIPSRGVLVVT